MTHSIFVLATSLALSVSTVFQPRTLDGRTYAETNTAIAWLNDGTYIQAQLAISNLSLRGGQGACRALMIRPGSPAWTADTLVDRDAWSSTLTPVPALSVGPCKATSTGRATTVDVQLDGTSVSIALSAAAQPTVPPGYPLQLGDAFYASEVLVPFAPVEVVLEPKEGQAQVLRGYGYADHSRSTSLPKNLARAWVRFRGFSERCSTVLSVRLPPGQGPAEGYMWQQAGQKPEALRGLAVAMPTENAQGVPFNLTVASTQRAFNLTATQLLYHDAPLENHGVLGRMVGAFIGHVATNTYAAVLHNEGPCGEVRGVMELEWTGD